MIEVGKYYRSKSGNIFRCTGFGERFWEARLVQAVHSGYSVGLLYTFNRKKLHQWEKLSEVPEQVAEQPQDNHVPGAKADSGKPDPTLILDGMASAILAVAEVATFGAEKYSRDGWKQVPNGFQRYSAAQDRHRLARAMGEERDPESGKLHAAHEAWNALAKLALYLENEDA